MDLPHAVPRGFFVGDMPWRWLVAAVLCLQWACAKHSTSGKHMPRPFVQSLLLSMSPPQLLRDIDDSRREPWVLFGAVVVWWQHFTFLKVRRTSNWLFVLICAWQRLCIFRARDELPPRRVAWCVRHGVRGRRIRFAAICASLRQSSMVLLCCVGGVTFLIRVFIVVGMVSPMIHWAQSSRKPLARAAVERARGTTSGSPRRVS